MRSLAYGPDGQWLVTGGDGADRLRIWDVATARVRKEIRILAGTFRSLTVSPDGRRVAATAYDQQSNGFRLHVCDLASGERLFSAHGGALAYSPDGATLASGSGDFTVRLWDTAPLKARYRARLEAEALRSEAERLVASFWRPETDPAEVVAALRADPVPSAPLRRAALRAVLRREQPPEPAMGDLHDTP